MRIWTWMCKAAPAVLVAAGMWPAASQAAQEHRVSPHGARIELDQFMIDATEVSVARFRNYAAARGIVTAAEREGGGFEWGAGWERRSGWTYRTPFGRPAADDEPAVHLSWFEARDYCVAHGGQLPDRAQWSLAAYTETRRAPPPGFVRGRTYPYPTGDTQAGANIAGSADGWERHAPVGRTREGVNGLFDAGGNVWEWLADARDDDRLTAGGSWWYDAAKMKAEGMQFKPASFYAVYVGFRCVYEKAP